MTRGPILAILGLILAILGRILVILGLILAILGLSWPAGSPGQGHEGYFLMPFLGSCINLILAKNH